MKKLVSLAIVLLLLASCASTNTFSVSMQSSSAQSSEASSAPSSSSEPASSNSSSTPASSSKPESSSELASSSKKPEDRAMLEKIIVTNEIDPTALDGRQKVVVRVENTSNKSFTGDVHVRVKNADGKSLVSDGVIIEKLNPGQETFANIFFPADASPVFSYEFSDEYSFEETEATPNGEKDEAVSKEITDSFMLNFSSTSWGGDVTNISIFTDGKSYWAEVVVSTDANAEKICNIAFANFKPNDVPIDKVTVVSSDGKELQQKVR